MEEILNYNSKLRLQQGVYAIHVIDTDNDINYIYIGSGALGNRTSGNKSKLKCGTHDCKVLQEKYNKYGNVKVEVLEVSANKEIARMAEQDWVDYYRRIDGCVVLNQNKTFVTTEPYSYKLNEDDVREIRRLYKEKLNMTITKLANQFGISNTHCSNIIHFRKWKEVV